MPTCFWFFVWDFQQTRYNESSCLCFPSKEWRTESTAEEFASSYLCRILFETSARVKCPWIQAKKDATPSTPQVDSIDLSVVHLHYLFRIPETRRMVSIPRSLGYLKADWLISKSLNLPVFWYTPIKYHLMDSTCCLRYTLIVIFLNTYLLYN